MMVGGNVRITGAWESSSLGSTAVRIAAFGRMPFSPFKNNSRSSNVGDGISAESCCRGGFTATSLLSLHRFGCEKLISEIGAG